MEPVWSLTKLFPLFFLCWRNLKLTVVSVASPSPNSPQKPVALPLNVALGQQILAVQQPSTTSPVKAGTSLSTAQVPLLLSFQSTKQAQSV